MKMQFIFAFTLIFHPFISMLAQPIVEWQKCLGGAGSDVGVMILPVNRSYIGLGSTNSLSGNVSGNHGDIDIWVFKLDSAGSLLWQKCLGGSGLDFGSAIAPTTDGGFIVIGSTASNDGDVSGSHGNDDVWFVKLNSAGEIDWQKCLGGSGKDIGWSIFPSANGGYFATGRTDSNDGDVSGNHGSSDCWVVKLDSTGILEWQKCLGGSGIDNSYFIVPGTDGGCVTVGVSSSGDGDVIGYHGAADCWVVKLSSSGSIQWQKPLGGSGADMGWSITAGADGGYVVAGTTQSNDGDVNGNHGLNDVLLIKLSADGLVQWQQCFGGALDDKGYSVATTPDGGYVLAGNTQSNNGDVSGNHGASDCWAVKLNSVGEIQWQKCLGGSADESGLSIRPTPDGGYALVGQSKSNDGDVSGNHGDADVWVVKLAADLTGLPSDSKKKHVDIFPNPASNTILVKTKDACLGKKYHLINSLGSVVLSGKILMPEMRLSIDHLPAGIYSFRLEGELAQDIRLVKD